MSEKYFLIFEPEMEKLNSSSRKTHQLSPNERSGWTRVFCKNSLEKIT